MVSPVLTTHLHGERNLRFIWRICLTVTVWVVVLTPASPSLVSPSLSPHLHSTGAGYLPLRDTVSGSSEERLLEQLTYGSADGSSFCRTLPAEILCARLQRGA